MTGRHLYELWCESLTSDRARYYNSMNPAEKEAWDRLASRVKLTWPGSQFVDSLQSAAQITDAHRRLERRKT